MSLEKYLPDKFKKPKFMITIFIIIFLFSHLDRIFLIIDKIFPPDNIHTDISLDEYNLRSLNDDYNKLKIVFTDFTFTADQNINKINIASIIKKLEGSIKELNYSKYVNFEYFDKKFLTAKQIDRYFKNVQTNMFIIYGSTSYKNKEVIVNLNYQIKNNYGVNFDFGGAVFISKTDTFKDLANTYDEINRHIFNNLFMIYVSFRKLRKY